MLVNLILILAYVGAVVLGIPAIVYTSVVAYLIIREVVLSVRELGRRVASLFR